jgi:hypothetical protein
MQELKAHSTGLISQFLFYLAPILFFGAVAIIFRKQILKSHPVARFLNPRKLLRKSRRYQIRTYKRLALSVIKDVNEALECPQSSPQTARALLPLVTDFRKRGEHLLTKRSLCHAFLFPALEKKLEPCVKQLIELERLLKSIPRSTLSLEDVLEGKFDTLEMAPTGLHILFTNDSIGTH